ncbi:hypothetical protein KHA80_16085 [Anaerobacillus sp. HL2]|nr:hypothetical protein KHA80_16085 [Anaerobacillus sp. HL2]
MVNVGDFVLLFANQNGNLPTKIFNKPTLVLDKEKYSIRFSDMTEALQRLEKD